PPLGKSRHFENAHAAIEADRQDVADFHRVSRRLFAHAVDADVTGFDQRGSGGAGLHHPRVPQPLIETLPLQISARLFLAVAGELFFQRRQFCKWRIGIGRTVALARCGTGRPLPVRGAAIALAALVASAEITAAALTLVAATTTLVAVALVAIELVAAVAVAALALDALAGRTVLTHFSRRCALSRHRGSHSLRRRALARFAEVITPATAMTL